MRACRLLFFRFFIRKCWLFVVAEHEDVLVVRFHEIALAGYFLYVFRVALEHAELAGVALVDGVVFVDFLLQVADFKFVFDSLNSLSQVLRHQV